MNARKMIFAAGFLLAGVASAAAESAYEPTNAVPQGLESGPGQQILHLSAVSDAPAQTAVQSRRQGGPNELITGNAGFRRGYDTFDVLDNIR